MMENFTKSNSDQTSMEQLVEIVVQIRKHNNNTKLLLSLIKIAKTAKVTRELLKDSQLGQTIGKLCKYQATKCSDKTEEAQICALSQSLKLTWKKQFKAGKNGLKKVARKDSCSSLMTNEVSYIPESETKCVATSQKLSSEIKECDSLPIRNYRTQILKKLVQVLRTPSEKDEIQSTEAKARYCQIGKEIENSLYEAYGYTNQYGDKVRSLVFNLGDKKNPLLRQKFFDGVIIATPLSMKQLTFKEMASDELKAKRAKVTKDSLQERNTDWISQNINQESTGMFTCIKCHSKNTKYTQQQIKSADEPMTNFVTCMDCRTMWQD